MQNAAAVASRAPSRKTTSWRMAEIYFTSHDVDKLYDPFLGVDVELAAFDVKHGT
jgi:hypothetical protein